MQQIQVNDLGKKIRQIREAEQMGRQEFSDKTGIPKNTLIGIEINRHKPSVESLLRVTNEFKKYTMWLTTGDINIEAGQISPEIEIARKTHNLKTGTDMH